MSYWRLNISDCFLMGKVLSYNTAKKSSSFISAEDSYNIIKRRLSQITSSTVSILGSDRVSERDFLEVALIVFIRKFMYTSGSCRLNSATSDMRDAVPI
jgi:hypothetical protein